MHGGARRNTRRVGCMHRGTRARATLAAAPRRNLRRKACDKNTAFRRMLVRPRAARARGSYQLARRTFLSAQRRQIAITEDVALPRATLFAVVADVARYREFVPFCGSSEIVTRRSRDSFDARLSLGFLAFTEEYVSQVQLTPPTRIVAEASNTPLFLHLRTEWRFDEGRSGEGSTRLHFQLEMQLRSAVHDQALRAVLDRVAKEQVAAFKKRCHEVHAANDPQVAGAAVAAAADGVAPVAASRGAAVAAEGEASAPASAKLPLLQVDPTWRRKVDAVFDAHALDGERLTMPRFVEACRALDVGSAQLHSWFVQFDEDASGGVERCEFVRNLWVLSRASEAERRAFIFHRLDMNGSGALEREDLSRSMRRQLGLARRLVPLLVRQQMRREATANLAMATANGGPRTADGARLESSRQRALRLREKASAVALAAIDELEAQVDDVVRDVFAGFGGDVERIDYEMWCSALSARSDVQRLHAGMGGVLGGGDIGLALRGAGDGKRAPGRST